MSLTFSLNARKRVRITPLKYPNPYRIKAFGFEVFVGGQWVRYSNTSGVSFNTSVPYRSIEWIRDEKHPGPPYKVGGPLLCVKAYIDDSLVQGNSVYTSGSNSYSTSKGIGPTRYVGGFSNPIFDGIDSFSSLYSNVDSLTSSSSVVLPIESFYPLVSKMKPKIQEANLAQFIGEFREVPKMFRDLSRQFNQFLINTSSSRDLLRQPLQLPKEVADEFLGVQFGWLPFLRDLQDFYRVTQNISALLNNLVQRNAKWDRIGRVFLDDSSDTKISSGDGFRVTPNGQELDRLCFIDGNGRRGYWDAHILDITKVWATGQFRFYRPEFDPSLSEFNSNWNYIQQLITLYGARVNPSVIWKLTPWSWLVDWAFNVGAVIDQLTLAQNDMVVSKELYLMHRRTRQIVLNQHFNFVDGARTLSFPRLIDVKQRDHAVTPFGFGLLPNGLSGMQYAILGALGLSKFT